MRDYKNADTYNIRRSLSSINSGRNILYKTPNNQVEFLNGCIMKTFDNYCPNKLIIWRYKDAPWMNNDIKRYLKEMAKIYNRYVKNNFGTVEKQLLEIQINETSDLISKANDHYFYAEVKKLLDPLLGPKRYRSI